MFIRNVRAGLIRWEIDRRRGKNIPPIKKFRTRREVLRLRAYSNNELEDELIRREVRLDPPIYMGRYE